MRFYSKDTIRSFIGLHSPMFGMLQLQKKWPRRYSCTCGKNEKKISIQTTLKTYLYSAVKNKCLNYIKLELPKQQSMADISEVMLSVSNAPKDEGENEQLKKYIQSAIDALPKKCRRIFILSRNAGMTYEEIAEELDLSKKTVENQMGIALKKLRESLEAVYLRYKELKS